MPTMHLQATRTFTPLRGALLSLIIFTAPITWAHEDHHHEAPAPVFTDAKQHAPTPLPDRVILTWSADPTSTIDITWRTDVTATSSVVQYAVANTLRGGMPTGKVSHALTAEGERADFESDLGTCHMHTAQLSGLTPNVMYAYRVGDGKYWSEWHQFRTASDLPEPFTFVYFGDAQNAVRSMWSRVVREANQYAPRAAFMLHAGDLINRSNSDAEWGEWFIAGGWLNGMIPSIATPGNHEYHGGLSGHWRPTFSFPLNGPEGLKETVYWLDYQGVRLISLNSNEQIQKQTPWLEKILSDPHRPKWTIVTFHHPVFSAARERDNPEIRNEWRPVLEKFGVDLVLQGHDHAYARSGLGGPANMALENHTGKNVAEGVKQKSSNTVYVVSVSGPKMYSVQEKWDMPRAASGVQLFQIIRVSQESIRYEARTAVGELYDAFTLTKDEQGVSELTEQIPDTPEILE